MPLIPMSLDPAIANVTTCLLQAEVVKTAKGQTLSQVAKDMLEAVDPDEVERRRPTCNGRFGCGNPSCKRRFQEN